MVSRCCSFFELIQFFFIRMLVIRSKCNLKKFTIGILLLLYLVASDMVTLKYTFLEELNKKKDNEERVTVS